MVKSVTLLLFFLLIATADSVIAGNQSPHWPHLRTMKTDFGLDKIEDPTLRQQEYDWAAAHYDHVVDGSVDEYKRRNPSIRVYPYRLNWSIIQPGYQSDSYAAMERWYAEHPEFQIEEGLLHDADLCPEGTPKTADCRMSIRIWDSDRWVINPGDPGIRAYQQVRLRAAADQGDGVFLDEHGSSDLQNGLKGLAIREYQGPTGWDQFLADLIEMIRLERVALAPGQRAILNVWKDTTDFDREMALAAGGAHTEGLNSPGEPIAARWAFVERLLADGVFVDFVTADFPQLPDGYSRGNSATPLGRAHLWALASYYMVIPADSDRLAFHVNGGWSGPLKDQWIGAQEIPVGPPLRDRFLFSEGNDRRHHFYQVWGRQFDGALVLVRPTAVDEEGIAFDDSTAVDLPLPDGETYVALGADGQVADQAIRRITLRNSEAAILLKREERSEVPAPP